MPGERSGSVLADWDTGDRPAPGPPDADKYSSRAFGGIPSPRQRVCVAEVRSISIASIQVLKYQASFSKPGPRAYGSSPLVVWAARGARGSAGLPGRLGKAGANTDLAQTPAFRTRRESFIHWRWCFNALATASRESHIKCVRGVFPLVLPFFSFFSFLF